MASQRTGSTERLRRVNAQTSPSGRSEPHRDAERDGLLGAFTGLFGD